MTMQVGSVDLGQGRVWFNALKEGRELVTVAQRNGAVATLAALLDLLAAPERVLPEGPATAAGTSLGELRLPVTAYRGEDQGLRGHDIPLLGAMPVPSWWRTASPAPATLPRWLRETDADRRALYGALSSVLDRLAGSGDRNAQAGNGGRSDGNLALIGVVALAGFAAWAYVARGAASDLIRERGEVQRFAEQAATTVKLYAERLRAFRDTGTMPPPSPAETALDPAGSRGVRGQGNDWWSKLGDGTWPVVAGIAGVSVAAGLAAWAAKKFKSNQAPGAPQTSDAPGAQSMAGGR